jgi:uroporphyrinogen decarboxylase
MNDRERFVACVLGEPVDRPPYWLFWGPWKTTRERWMREGLSDQVADHRTLFDSDKTPRAIPVNCGPCPRIEPTVIEETADSVVHVDSWGIERRDLKGRESMSEFLRFPVQTQEDWWRFKEERLNPDDPARLDGDWRERCVEWRAQGIPLQLGYYPDVGVFGVVRWLLGNEEGLVAYYSMPDLVHEIMDHMTGLYLTVFERVVREVSVDVIHIWEDMCSRNGPLISPRHWDEFIGPNYRRIKAFAERHGIPVISVDTDGNPDLIAARMMRDGVNLLFPMEVAAGCDVNEWRNKYPTLAMMGGVDKRALAAGREAIDRELARIRPAVEMGRYIPALDHLVPDDVSWEDYGYYAEALRKLVGTL